MKNIVTFGGISAAPGTRSTGWCPVPGTTKRLPVTVINGSGEGMSVLITSAIHGCEYPSIEAVFELAETLDPARVKGQIVFVNPRKCLRIVKQNIAFALGVKVLCLLLAAIGIANMWVAIIADVGVMILAVLNAIR